MIRFTHIVGLTLLGALAGAESVKAQTLYGITFNQNQLITIDTSTAAGTLVGPLNPAMVVTGLGFRGSKLYTWDQSIQRLRELDPLTAATLATIDIGANAPGEGDITFRADGIGFLSKVVGPELIRFDLTGPSSSSVGPLNPNFDGLAFSPTGVLYGLREGGQELYTIDATTAVATMVGNTGITGFTPTGGAGIAFDPSGNLFAVVTNNAAAPSILFRVDPVTANATLIGPIGFNGICGLSFSPAPAPPPPPPPPPPVPASPPPSRGDEGTYRRCNGPGGAEGTFGFGGGQANSLTAPRSPLLTSPRLQAGEAVVFNVAQRDGVDSPRPAEFEFPGLLVLIGSALIMGAMAVMLRR